MPQVTHCIACGSGWLRRIPRLSWPPDSGSIQLAVSNSLPANVSANAWVTLCIISAPSPGRRAGVNSTSCREVETIQA